MKFFTAYLPSHPLRSNTLALITCLLVLSVSQLVAAAATLEVTVTNEQGEPLDRVMVTLVPTVDKAGLAVPEITGFTSSAGIVTLPAEDADSYYLRARKAGFMDGELDVETLAPSVAMTLMVETDPLELAEAKPANAWLAAISMKDDKFMEHFRLQCTFCHQQGSPAMRVDRTEEEWAKVINRMLRYGSRLMTEAQEDLPALITKEHKRLNTNPASVPNTRPWGPEVAGASIREWRLGNGSSQLHDVFLASSGLVYAGDNLQDDLIELNPATGETKTHKIPKRAGDELGGNIGGRLKNFPGVGTYVGLHSLDESPVDGHLFLTGSDSSRLVEFAPETGAFTLYDLPEGFYPHTIRIDAKDRVWFTMAVSNQIAMYDRKAEKFTFYDLPTRGFKEALTINSLPVIMKLAEMGMDTHKFAVDEKSTGLPMPYGIDIAPDGTVWFARLFSDEIGKINPETGTIKMYKTPFLGPRRLRTDGYGNVWISVFASGRIAKFDPKTEEFELIALPTEPLGSETPYSLAVDTHRNHVWVNGTASDTMIRYDVDAQSWSIYPLPRRRTFTRDVAIAKDGSIFTSNGSFPAWHIEDGQPTLIHVIPADIDPTLPRTKGD